MVSRSGEARVADFGLSHVYAGSTSALAATLNPSGTKGSSRWMAMELFDFEYELDAVKTPDKESDVWSFGMVVYVRITSSRIVTLP